MGLKSILGGISDIFGAGGLATSVTDILKGAGILKDPEAEFKTRALLLEYEMKVRENEVRVIEAINETMRSEASSHSWLQSSWRPIVGLTFCAVIVNNFILLPYFVSYGLQPILIPDGVWSAMLVVLGVAAGTRGLEKWQIAKNGNGK